MRTICWGQRCEARYGGLEQHWKRAPRAKELPRPRNGGEGRGEGVSAAELAPSPLTPTLSPRWAGLSHMSKELEEEGLAPSGEFHFSGNGLVRRVVAQDVESHSPYDR